MMELNILHNLLADNRKNKSVSRYEFIGRMLEAASDSIQLQNYEIECRHVFSGGKIQILSDKDGVFAFKRIACDSEMCIALNFGKADKTISFDGRLTDYLSGKRYANEFILERNGFAVLISDK